MPDSVSQSRVYSAKDCFAHSIHIMDYTVYVAFFLIAYFCLWFDSRDPFLTSTIKVRSAEECGLLDSSKHFPCRFNQIILSILDHLDAVIVSDI